MNSYELFEGIRKGDINKIRTEITQAPHKINKMFNNGHTPLTLAINNLEPIKHLEPNEEYLIIIKYLLEVGADPTIKQHGINSLQLVKEVQENLKYIIRNIERNPSLQYSQKLNREKLKYYQKVERLIYQKVERLILHRVSKILLAFSKAATIHYISSEIQEKIANNIWSSVIAK